MKVFSDQESDDVFGHLQSFGSGIWDELIGLRCTFAVLLETPEYGAHNFATTVRLTCRIGAGFAGAEEAIVLEELLLTLLVRYVGGAIANVGCEDLFPWVDVDDCVDRLALKRSIPAVVDVRPARVVDARSGFEDTLAFSVEKEIVASECAHYSHMLSDVGFDLVVTVFWIDEVKTAGLLEELVVCGIT